MSTSRDHLDALADPDAVLAFPGERAIDLMGGIRAGLRAGDRAVVAYGWTGQRIEIPADEVGEVCTAGEYRLDGKDRRDALFLLDQRGRVLLRAPGEWRTFEDVLRVCQAAGLPRPAEKTSYGWRALSPEGKIIHLDKSRKPMHRDPWDDTGSSNPAFTTAAGYQLLRTASPWLAPRVTVLGLLALAVLGAGGLAGATPAIVMPGWFGEVRFLIGGVGAAAGVAAGVWLCAQVSETVTDALRWLIASARARCVAPPSRFFRHREVFGRREESRGLPTIAVVVISVLLAGMVVFGPGVGVVSLAHGIRDSDLVANLKAHGARVPGFLIDDREIGTDDHGKKTVTDTPILEFKDRGGHAWQAVDPSIGGHPLPLDASDPEGTRDAVTVYYLPDDPGTAAAGRQLARSPWRGAPEANVITGLVLTLAGIPLTVLILVVGIRRRKLYAADLLNDLARA